ncbi:MULTISPECIES: LCP family protein [Streptomycetaceae]|uniref:Transcriptional regulator n=1 Tax=Streptantibioticus cattleyicolor (strain ATCC 35852 / DSM 46488 / JCM 4925 / NBRC 14057 / NRRL 8057) TaxID=1003195 RepID=F8K1Q1_STREN|nr:MULTISPECIES: LCP family protein [Streptomycetaceae]AEW95317.1 transcriptional regulator [Streptantibioticus cattleyicolor NRRL 8057 = DSM 46488]MYS59897.1 LytR family transcriptional regulator [Streptomyces sp. SID5468]CCB75660.1 Transcriptional regulator [Streptantibioticus cattleyicolor NRRL 8057 = DSM 46488]
MADVSHRRRASAAGRDGVPRPRRGGRTDDEAPPAEGTRRRAAGRSRRKTRKRSAKKIIGLTALAVVVIVAGAGVFVYEHLNANIKSVAITGGGQEKADAFGRTPINILVIGSDGRNNAADCKIGGDCGPGQNADVEMVVHISADRSNATAMSVPRDTVTQIPSCTDEKTKQKEPGYTGAINSALQYGPDCQVAAVHQLTGIPIDHFAMIDFSGVVSMSDAVGGVPVCVDNNVYDTDSHLKLRQGSHTLQGMAALEWLRSRHAFGTGSDLGRTETQHMYLAALMRKFKSGGTLTDPAALYRLADAATKALTVDTGLNSVSKLIGFAEDLDKVPTDRITFTTMQTAPDPNDDQKVVVGPGARSLFQSIIDDQSLAGGDKPAAGAHPGGSASTPPSPSAPPASRIAVQVKNAGGVTGRAARIVQHLTDEGFSQESGYGDAPAASRTTVRYAPGGQPAAQVVARALGIPADRLREDAAVSSVTVVVGSDWGGDTSFPASGDGASHPPVDTKKALSDARALTADKSGGCAKVSTFPTLKVNGVWMTPIKAYAVSPDVPDSAP